MKILVTGANGQVGQELQFLATNFTDFDIVFTDSSTLDITNEAAVIALFETHQFDYCLNCAAYTAVDKAESNQELAFQVNVVGTENLAKACAKHKTWLVHLSTDYVYHTNINRPYIETDETAPKCVYAATKLEGSQKALVINPLTTIIRTSWVYSSFRHNFVKTMLRLSESRTTLSVVFDQIGTPTYARDLALAMLKIVEQINASPKNASQIGIFHYSNEGVTSWYDFAHAVYEITQTTMVLLPIESKDYPTPAKRPHFSVLNKAKIKNTFNLTIPHWRTALLQCIITLQHENKTIQ